MSRIYDGHQIYDCTVIQDVGNFSRWRGRAVTLNNRTWSKPSNSTNQPGGRDDTRNECICVIGAAEIEADVEVVGVGGMETGVGAPGVAAAGVGAVGIGGAVTGTEASCGMAGDAVEETNGGLEVEAEDVPAG